MGPSWSTTKVQYGPPDVPSKKIRNISVNPEFCFHNGACPAAIAQTLWLHTTSCLSAFMYCKVFFFFTADRSNVIKLYKAVEANHSTRYCMADLWWPQITAWHRPQVAHPQWTELLLYWKCAFVIALSDWWVRCYEKEFSLGIMQSESTEIWWTFLWGKKAL